MTATTLQSGNTAANVVSFSTPLLLFGGEGGRNGARLSTFIVVSFCTLKLFSYTIIILVFLGGGRGKEGMQSCNNTYYTVVVSFCTPKFFSQTSFWGRKGGTLQSCNTSIFLGGGIWGWGGLSHVSCICVTQCSQCIPFYCCYFCSCNFSHFGSKFFNFLIDDYKGKVQNIF